MTFDTMEEFKRQLYWNMQHTANLHRTKRERYYTQVVYEDERGGFRTLLVSSTEENTEKKMEDMLRELKVGRSKIVWKETIAKEEKVVC